MTNSVFLIRNHSSTLIVLQLWCWLATKVHMAYLHVHPPEKSITQKQAFLPCCQTLVDSSTWIVYHSDSLTLSNNCASVSSAILSVLLVMVLAKRGTCATFWTTDSPQSSQQMSLAAARINFSPTVKDFLALAMQLATKNDTLSADTFDEVVAFNNCFCSSCSCFFLWKNSKGLSFNAGAWYPCNKAVLKVSWLSWIAGCHILCKVGLESVNHLL